MNIEIFGIPVEISLWHFAVMLLFWVDGTLYVKRMHEGAKAHNYITAGFFSLIVVFVSLILHEIAHAVVAIGTGVNITKAGLTFLGAYVTPEISLYDMSPFQELVISIAGPLSNFAIAGIFAFLVWSLDESVAENTFQYFSYINLRLGYLNILPIIPLDGSKVCHAIFRWFINDPDIALFLTLPLTIITIILLIVFRKRIKTTKFLEDL